MDGEIMENPHFLMDDLEVFTCFHPPIFGNIHKGSMTSSTAAVTRRQDRELEHFRERQHEEFELERRRHGGMLLMETIG